MPRSSAPWRRVGRKDNTALPSECDQCGNRYLLDTENAAVIRTHNHMRHLYKLAGLKLVRSDVQTGFPEDLHPVRMYWLQPIESSQGVQEEENDCRGKERCVAVCWCARVQCALPQPTNQNGDDKLTVNRFALLYCTAV